MANIATTIANIDFTGVYDAIGDVAAIVAASLTPTLLIISIHIRLFETQLSGLSGGTRWGEAIKDILVYSFLCGSYFLVGSIVIDMINPIFAWIDGLGSVAKLTEAMGEIFKKFSENQDNQSAWDILNGSSFFSLVYLLIGSLAYWSTLLLLAAISTFLKFGFVLLFGVVYVWGLIAIPVSVSRGLNIMRGWAYFVGFLIAWPVVQGLMMFFLRIVFVDAGVSILEGEPSDNMAAVANVQLLMAVLNLLAIAVMIAAPFLAQMLVTNAPAGYGAAMPFLGAAVASVKQSGSGVGDQIRRGWGKISGGGSGGSGGSTRQSNLSGNSKISGNSKSSPGSESQSPAKRVPSRKENAEQNRRGYFVNKQKSKSAGGGE